MVSTISNEESSGDKMPVISAASQGRDTTLAEVKQKSDQENQDPSSLRELFDEGMKRIGKHR